MTHENKINLTKLYQLYEQPMYRIAYAVLKNSEQAEDAVHDAFVSIMKSNADLSDAASPETKHFMIQAIRNTAINRYRKNKKEAECFTVLDDSAYEIPDKGNTADEAVRDIEMSESINEILKGVRKSDREILIMRCCDELSFREISLKLGISEAAVRKRFERARKSALKQKGEDLNVRKKLYTF